MEGIILSVFFTFIALILFAGKLLKMIEMHKPAFITARFLTVFRFIMMVFSVALTTYMFAIYGEGFLAKYDLTETQKNIFLFFGIFFGFILAVVLEIALLSAEKTVGYINSRKTLVIYVSTYIFLISVNILTMLAGLNKTAENLASLEKKHIEKSEEIGVLKENEKLLKENKKRIEERIKELKEMKNNLSIKSQKEEKYKRELLFLERKMQRELKKFSPPEKFPTKRAEIERIFQRKMDYWRGLIEIEKRKTKEKEFVKKIKIDKEIDKKTKELIEINNKLSLLAMQKVKEKRKIKDEISKREKEKFYKNWKIVFAIQFFNLIAGVLSSLLIKSSQEEEKNIRPSIKEARRAGSLKPSVQKMDDEKTLFNLVYEIAKEESKKSDIWTIIDGKMYLKHISRDKLKSALLERGIKWNGNYNEFYARYSKDKKDLFVQKGNERAFADTAEESKITDSIKI